MCCSSDYFERDIIRDRTKAGLNAARARGRLGGRPKKLDSRKIGMAKALMADHSNSIKDICKTLNISKSTLYRCVKFNNAHVNKNEPLK